MLILYVTINFVYCTFHNHLTEEMVMKVIYMIRHGIKGLGDQVMHITPDCLRGILLNGIQGVPNNVNRVHLGSDCVRTRETITAFAGWLVANGGHINGQLIQPDARLGSDSMFKEMFPAPIKAIKEEKGLSNFGALMHNDRRKVSQWHNDVLRAMRKIFWTISDNDIVAVPTHSPIIEIAMNIILEGKLDPQMAIAELQWARFEQHSNGSITLFSDIKTV